MESFDFDIAVCACKEVVLDGLFTGVVRTRCRGCKKRVWAVSDGRTVRTALVDSAPREVVGSELQTTE